MIRASAERVIYGYGTSYTLRKATAAAGANEWTRGAETVAYTTCTARERGYKPSEVRGSIVQGDVLLVVAAGSLGGIVPAVGDRIAQGVQTADVGANWRQVVNVYAPQIGAEGPAVYRLQIRQ